MDRRHFLQAAGLAGLAPSPALAQYASSGAALPAPPKFPPIDARSVWMVGDSGPVRPIDTATRTLELLKGAENVADGYLKGGAVATLEADFARFLGKADCAFFPTGTLANAVAIRVLCGDARHAIAPYESHVFRDESDTVQRLAGINLVALGREGVHGSLSEIDAAIGDAENGPYPLKVGCLMFESPVRRRDGRIVPKATIDAAAALASKHAIPMHLDAARLMLAPPSLDVKAYCAPFETVYVSLYKYLGAPFGAVLAGSKESIAKARDWRHVYGGTILEGWEPALLAGAALKTFPADMARAHATADVLLRELERRGTLRVRPMPDRSNIVFLEMSEAAAAAAFERSRAAGVRMGRWKAGAMPFYVNATLNRRPVDEYVRLFTG